MSHCKSPHALPHALASVLPHALALLALLALLLGAAGCSGLQSKEPAAQVYTLTPSLPEASGGQAAALVTIKVLRPWCAPGLDSDNIAMTRSGQRFDFYAHSRWAAPLPELVQASAVDALRAAGHFRAVQSDAVPLAGDYLLQLEIKRFQAEYRGDGAPLVRVQLVATLGRSADRSLVSSVVAMSDVPAGANRVQSVSAAFETALGQVLAQLAQQIQPPAGATYSSSPSASPSPTPSPSPAPAPATSP
jgi:cholesterol transport system auxiliary component